jgi:hypothetical protein
MEVAQDRVEWRTLVLVALTVGLCFCGVQCEQMDGLKA